MKILTDEKIGQILEIFNRSTPYIDILQGAKAQLDQDKVDAEADKAHYEGLIEFGEFEHQRIVREIFQFFSQHASGTLFDGKEVHEQSVEVTIPVFGGHSYKDSVYIYQVPVKALQALKSKYLKE